jgi:hypothetical protein
LNILNTVFSKILHTMKRLLYIVVFFVMMPITYGQSPRGFNFQAVARDGSGEIITGKDLTVKVRIHSGNENGPVEWEEIHQASPNAYGLFDLVVCGDNGLRSGGGAPDIESIDWASGPHFIRLLVDTGSGEVDLGASALQSVPYALVSGSITGEGGTFEVQPMDAVPEGEALFIVKRPDGFPVFAVYEDGVWVYTDEENVKGVKGGFAVGGYTSDKKSVVQEYMRVTSDSTRIYINTNPAKGIKGGFAVGGYSDEKVGEEEAFMRLSRDNYFIGHNSGLNLTSGLYNAILGYESGMNITSGGSNSFIGYQSGFNTNEGTGNLFLGYQTGYKNFDGNYNTFLGYHSGYSNRGGTNNTFLGSFSGYSNVGGSYNTMVGDSAGYYNVGGVHNTFLGTKAGQSNTNGSSNLFIGDNAGHNNEDGSENVFLGRNAGYSNVATARNVFIGTEAGYNHTDFWDNIFIGTFAGRAHETGAGNVFLGYESGKNNVEGTRNIFLGNQAGFNETGSNKLYISNSANDSTGALVWGDFLRARLRFNGTVGVNMHPVDGRFSVYNPWGAGGLGLYGKGNGFDYSFLQLHADTTGEKSSYVLSHSMDDSFFLIYNKEEAYLPRLVINDQGHMGMNTFPVHDKTLVLKDEGNAALLELRGTGNAWDYAGFLLTSDGQDPERSYGMIHRNDNTLLLAYIEDGIYSPRIMIDSLGRVSLNNNWDSGTEILDVGGNARFRGVGSAIAANDLQLTPNGTLTTNTSDARLKSEFQEITNSLGMVLQMKGYTFRWKEADEGRRDAGLVAQEVAEIFPEAVFQNPTDGYYGINYSRFPALFVEAFKEQQAIIEDQQSEIDLLKERLERLEECIGGME